MSECIVINVCMFVYTFFYLLQVLSMIPGGPEEEKRAFEGSALSNAWVPVPMYCLDGKDIRSAKRLWALLNTCVDCDLFVISFLRIVTGM